jgi:hypothetical protein
MVYPIDVFIARMDTLMMADHANSVQNVYQGVLMDGVQLATAVFILS